MEVTPTPEAHRQYVDEKNGKVQTAAIQKRGVADTKLFKRRRAVFACFAATRALLTRVTVGQLVEATRGTRGKVRTLSVDATCGEALSLLAAEPSILSAPVVDLDRLLVRPRSRPVRRIFPSV